MKGSRFGKFSRFCLLDHFEFQMCFLYYQIFCTMAKTNNRQFPQRSIKVVVSYLYPCSRVDPHCKRGTDCVSKYSRSLSCRLNYFFIVRPGGHPFQPEQVNLMVSKEQSRCAWGVRDQEIHLGQLRDFK